jgi:hypothetical protein
MKEVAWISLQFSIYKLKTIFQLINKYQTHKSEHLNK